MKQLDSANFAANHWNLLFIPDPDPDFLPIPDPESRDEKGTLSRIRIRNTGKIFRKYIG
jgi:hypothetical protein